MVANEARDGAIRVELRLVPEALTTIPLQHGLPGTVEVEVERVSPAALVLRGVGQRLGVSPRGAVTAQSHEGVP
jgi:membrane fusion protein (multidrug efflux system)